MDQRRFTLRDVPGKLVLQAMNKMNFNSLMNLRRTTSWLNNFANDYATEIRVSKPIYAVEVDLGGIVKSMKLKFQKSGESQFVPKWIREADLSLLRPQAIIFSCGFHRNRITPETLGQHCAFMKKLNWLEGAIIFPQHFDFHHRLPTFLDTVMKYGITKLDLSTCGDYNGAVSSHPLFSTLRYINVTFSGESQDFDLSFILAPREEGELYLRCSAMTKAGMDNIKKLFKFMAEGKIGIRTFVLKGFLHIARLNMNPFYLIEGIENRTLFWSHATHKQSTIAHENLDYRNRSFLQRYYYTVPLPNGKIGGFCVSEEYGDLVMFKTYDKVEDLTKELCL